MSFFGNKYSFIFPLIQFFSAITAKDDPWNMVQFMIISELNLVHTGEHSGIFSRQVSIGGLQYAMYMNESYIVSVKCDSVLWINSAFN